MRFYDIGRNYENLIRDDICRVFPRVEVVKDDGSSYFMGDSDIISLEVRNFKEASGGYSNYGELVLDNRMNRYSVDLHPELRAGCELHIHYAMGNRFNSFYRFSLYADERGFQTFAEGSDKKCRVRLRDYSAFLKDSDKGKDWTGHETLVHGVYCNRAIPSFSLVHVIADRAGLTSKDIDCCLLDKEVPFVRFTGSVWEELSLLATAAKAHLECTKDMVLSFEGSPYDADYPGDDAVSWSLDEDDITGWHSFDLTDLYRNSLRMKWTHYRETGMTELWRYRDAPSMYDEEMRTVYPMGRGSREIEMYESYEAVYSVKDSGGKEFPVVKAFDLDSREIFEADIDDSEGSVTVDVYNTTSYPDRALVKLSSPVPTNLRRAVIYGRAIIAEQNFCHFVRNQAGINQYGTSSENITNKYMSDTETEGIPFYEKWAGDTLEEMSRMRRGLSVRTNRALFHARAGALMEIDLSDVCGIRVEKGEITSLVLRYRKDAAFETTVTVTA
ncbi:MAG: hypothetical protein K5930_11400 [Treponemataceae bacterium]|nr:hypothetical protein [Treponemataceae bacterium]